MGFKQLERCASKPQKRGEMLLSQDVGRAKERLKALSARYQRNDDNSACCTVLVEARQDRKSTRLNSSHRL